MPNEIMIYGPIGMAAGTTAEEVLSELSGDDDVLVRINSAGGSFTDGPAIYNALRNHGGRVDTVIDGVGYSMASVILQAGKNRSMAENAVIMVHGAQFAANGSSSEMRKAADMMDVHTKAMRSAFVGRGISESVVDGWLNDGEDHFFTAEDALAAGLIDEISSPVDMAAALTHIPRDIPLPQQLAAYRNPPTGATLMP
ncbi:MAG: head maturation protease, ClpP-related, partial [Thiogranum sp.]